MATTMTQPQPGPTRRGDSAGVTSSSGTAVGGRSPVRTALRYVLLVALALIFVSPLIFMILTSFKTSNDAGAVGAR